MENFNGKALVIDDVELGRYSLSSDGNLFDFKLNKLLEGHLNRGYPRVTLMQTNNKQKSYYIHTLVAVMFIGDLRGESMTVNHIDGVKTNKDVSNLEWLTHRENMKHAMDTGLLDRRPLTEDIVREICRLKEQRLPNGEIAKMTNRNIRTIESIVNGYNWKDISSQYNFPEKITYKVLSEYEVRKICELFVKDYTIKEVSEIMNIPYPTVSSLRQKVSHKSISDNYF